MFESPLVINPLKICNSYLLAGFRLMVCTNLRNTRSKYMLNWNIIYVSEHEIVRVEMINIPFVWEILEASMAMYVAKSYSFPDSRLVDSANAYFRPEAFATDWPTVLGANTTTLNREKCIDRQERVRAKRFIVTPFVLWLSGIGTKVFVRTD